MYIQYVSAYKRDVTHSFNNSMHLNFSPYFYLSTHIIPIYIPYQKLKVVVSIPQFENDKILSYVYTCIEISA